ncbi:MAG: hypothetical protein R2828_30100 [Saprospiraceae bacterium]
MQNPNFQPTTTIAQIQAFKEIQYLKGAPRAYRFDAKGGSLSFRGETKLTNKGEAFTFIPIAYRLFSAEILGYDHRKWVEFYFINQIGQVCSVLFHGYSVDNLRLTFADMHYDRVNFTQVKLTVKPEQRTNQHGSYYLASFSYEVLKQKEAEALESIVNALDAIYREDTLTENVHVALSQNYSAPEREGLEEAAEAKVLAA